MITERIIRVVRMTTRRAGWMIEIFYVVGTCEPLLTYRILPEARRIISVRIPRLSLSRARHGARVESGG